MDSPECQHKYDRSRIYWEPTRNYQHWDFVEADELQRYAYACEQEMSQLEPSGVSGLLPMDQQLYNNLKANQENCNAALFFAESVLPGDWFNPLEGELGLKQAIRTGKAVFARRSFFDPDPVTGGSEGLKSIIASAERALSFLPAKVAK